MPNSNAENNLVLSLHCQQLLIAGEAYALCQCLFSEEIDLTSGQEKRRNMLVTYPCASVSTANHITGR